MDVLIEGVSFKNLVTHADSRGFFRELVRHDDAFFQNAFGQWSHSKMAKNTVKAWHFHHRQVDWWYVGLGLIEVVLFDLREESPTFETKMHFLLGETEFNSAAKEAVIRIPIGVAHGCRVMSDVAHLFYITSKTYNAQDEGRLPFNSRRVNHDWGNSEELIVAPNDTRELIPPFPRER